MHAVVLAALALLQRPADSSFFDREDLLRAGVVAAAAVALAPFDERIARWMRSPSVQGDSGRHDLVSAITVVNEMPLTVAAVLTYGVGRATGSRTVTEVGAHVTLALLVTEVASEVVRAGVGRARPRASPGDAFVFKPGQGLTRFEYRSFPSLHASVAFTTAAAIDAELRQHHVEHRRVLTPLLYGLATVPGFTRLYLDQHWASDVLVGAALGAWVGGRVVRYAHARRTRWDVWLVPSSHDAGGGALLGVRWTH